jgi:hypothetical protein
MRIKFYIIIVLIFVMFMSFPNCHEVVSNAEASTSMSTPIAKSTEGEAVPIAVNNKEILKLPDLPKNIKNIKEIAPKGWSILDLLSNDFNGDGLKDIIGVIEHPIDDKIMYPRILFVYFNKGYGYSLNITNPYLIRNKDEGGVFGDPYQEITASKNTFTTNAYGGSGWRWSENHTFEFKNGLWYLMSIKQSYGYGSFETSYTYNNYKSCIGSRRVTEESPEKKNPLSLKYYVKLDKQPLLEDFAYTVFLSEERILHPEINSIGYNTGITHFEGNYPQLDESSILARNKKYVVYKINQAKDIAFIGVYTYANKKLQIIARYNSKDQNEEGFSDFSATIYKDRIYYNEDINKLVSIQEKGKISKQREVIAVQLISEKLDGSDKKVIFKVNNPQYKENKTIENGLDYMSLIYEITGNEIIVQVFGGNNQPYYKMNLQGGEKRLIGSIPRGDW